MELVTEAVWMTMDVSLSQWGFPVSVGLVESNKYQNSLSLLLDSMVHYVVVVSP